MLALVFALFVQDTADELELLNGQKYKGKLIEETDDSIVFQVAIAGGGTKRKFPIKDVYAVWVGNEKRVINEKGKKPAKTADPPKSKGKTKDDIEALIKKVGPTPPDWYDKTPLNYPKTLDLSWPEPPPTKGWDAGKNVGQFIWSTINENPSRWKEGVRFMHYMLTVHKDDKKVLARIMRELGRMYKDFFEDWPRSAFWYRKSMEIEPDNDGVKLALADDYWKMGCKEMAVEIAKNYSSEFTRHGALIKLWSDMGELDKAIELAEEFAKGGYPDIGYLAAGDACRLAGKFSEAIKYYQKAIDAPDGGRDIPKNKNRAKASMEAVKLFDSLDLKKIAPGKYTAESMGYEAPVKLEVTVNGGRIADIKVVEHHEKQFYSSIADTPRRIIEKQSVKGIDATTGATLTSEAIINATAKALSSGLKK